MKTPRDNSKNVKRRNNKKIAMKPKKETVLLVAQEFKFARLLSGNEKKTRDRVLKTLKKWLTNCFDKKYEFKEDDFIRVWKGLFYAVWMSDKPLVQEDLCESIAAILDLFPTEQLKHALLMVKAGFKVLAMEWYGIDHHRMDKFLMLARRYLRGSFRCLLRSDWRLDCCQQFADMLSASDGLLADKTPVYARNAMSLVLHIIDCYLEELSKVSKGQIPEESVAAILAPLTAQVCGGEALSVAVAARRALTALIRQSAEGLRYQDATAAWQQMGCPPGGPEALELMSDDEEQSDASDDDDDDKEEEQDAPLDPRAGRVDAVLRPLAVPAKALAAQLRRGLATAAPRAHQRAKICLQRFEELARSEYPLRLPAEAGAAPARGVTPGAQARAAARLSALERRLVADADELALRGLSRKNRKRLLARSRAGASLADQLATTDGSWKVNSVKTDKNKNKDSNKENERKEKNRKRNLPNDGNDNQKPTKITKTNELFPPNIQSDKKEDAVDKNKISVENNKKRLRNGVKSKENNNIKSKELQTNLKSKEVQNNLKYIQNNKSKEIQNNKSKELESSVKEKKENVEEKKNLNKVNKVKETPLVDKRNKSNIKKNEEVKKSSQEQNGNKNNTNKVIETPKTSNTKVLVSKLKNYQKQIKQNDYVDGSPKKVKFVLKNNCMQGPVDYYKSVRRSPSIPFDSSKQPIKTNLKPSTPSPINPFLKRKYKLKR